MKKIILAIALMATARAWAQDRVDPPVPNPGNATLPLDQYNHLLELAGAAPKHVESAPLPYVLKQANLKFRVSNDSALGTVEILGETLRDGECKVGLTSGMTILDAKQDGKTLAIEEAGGTETAILGGPSDFSVTLNAGLPIFIETGRASLHLPVPAAGSVSLTLEVPGEHTNVRLSSGLITNQSSSNGVTTIESVLVPGQTTNIWWATREVAAPAAPREARFLSSINTLVSVSEADIRLAVFADVTVVQGEPAQFELQIPAGYEVTGTSGASVDSSDVQNGVLIIKVNAPSQRTHEFLISLEKQVSSTKADVPFLSMKNAQRETGEVLVEGVGTMELTATEGGGLKRMDFKETNASLSSLARSPLQAAFRYHRQPAENPSLALEWTRFPDSSVLAAIAEQATVTTMVTTEGRSLTEVRLSMRNQAQPFLKIELPSGASIVTAEVSGEKVKPVEAPDGQRVPLLRVGFRPIGSYEVSFVYMDSGTPFAKKGGSEVTLPKMDVPIGVLHWEVFLPERFKVKDFGGDALAANLLPASYVLQAGVPASVRYDQLVGYAGGVAATGVAPLRLLPGQLGGYVVDPSGAVVTNAQVSVTQPATGVTRNAVTDSSGRWVVWNLSTGPVQVKVSANGFRTTVQNLGYNSDSPMTYSMALQVGATAQTVEIQSSAMAEQDSRYIERDLKKDKERNETAGPASANVLNLQRRVAGVLPVRVDVPRAGNSYDFTRALVLDEPTKLTFTYKTK
ncbi:MAG TPA: carboxypeptidase-like regulatory domain-containing protein [Candidatus Acidoferrum sp.]|nr:carboxypeptidase-like regulatory domain-containing protein [Candidatus Acidoferrum sp.]